MDDDTPLMPETDLAAGDAPRRRGRPRKNPTPTEAPAPESAPAPAETPTPVAEISAESTGANAEIGRAHV